MHYAIVRRYLKLLLIGGSLATMALFIYAAQSGRLPANFWIFRCDASGYSADHFIAYCSDPAFGDYEHAAMYFGTDQAIADSLRAAAILFVGNSRAQKAFSAAALEQHFEPNGVRYYNMATSGEMDIFPRRVIQHLDLRPRVVVVGADYFFYNSLSDTGKKVTSGTARALLENRMKALVQAWHQKWCGSSEASFVGSVVCRSDPRFTIYKSRRNGRISSGQWPESVAELASADGPYPSDKMPNLIDNARTFQRFLRERGTCLVATAIPYRDINADAVRDLARAAGMPFIAVSDEGLFTYDGSHMDWPSAELWAKRFLMGFDSAVQACDAPAS